MFVVFWPTFVAVTKIIFGYNIEAHLTLIRLDVLRVVFSG